MPRRWHSLRVILALLISLPAWGQEAAVGFAIIAVPNGAAAPIETAIWYPAEGATVRPTRIEAFSQDLAPGAALRGRGLPLVVISHGSGGSLASHVDTALALAQSGFVVAALTHPGDNFRDQSGATDMAARTGQLAAVIGHVAGRWMDGAVDPARIGAFGFSAGAFTVLAVAGGVPELTRIAAHCAANPGFYDCRLMAGRPAAAVPPVMARTPLPLRALVVAAPALGFTYGPGSLAALTMPVQLWQAGADAILPAPHYMEPVRAALPGAAEFRSVPDAGHFDFLAPCPEGLARAVPAICTSAPGFDRAAFHARLNADVVRFMMETLRR